MSTLEVHSWYDSQEKGWDAYLVYGGWRLKVLVTTAFLYNLGSGAGKRTTK